MPFVVPNVDAGTLPPTAAWGDAAVIVPWVLYQRYGDPGILADQFDSMRAWVDCVAAVAGTSRLWDRGFQFGDWLDPSAPPDRPGEARADASLVATAYFARSAELLGHAAGVLDKPDEQARYLALAAEVREAFDREYIYAHPGVWSATPPPRTRWPCSSDCFASPSSRQHAGARLAALVAADGYHIGTGFVGTPLICDALCSAGQWRHRLPAAHCSATARRGCTR